MRWYLAAACHRLGWNRVDRVLGERGIRADTAERRREWGARLESRRRQADASIQTPEADG